MPLAHDLGKGLPWSQSPILGGGMVWRGRAGTAIGQCNPTERILMSTFTLILRDTLANYVIAREVVTASSRNDALRQRPAGWPRNATAAYRGLV